VKVSLFLFWFALLGLARADLGDKYSVSCQRFGRPVLVDKQSRFIYWAAGNGDLIGEQFKSNQCVCYLYLSKYTGGVGYREQDVWTTLARNARRDQTWIPNQEESGRGWATSDGQIYAKEFVLTGKEISTLVFRVAYTSWLKRNGFLKIPVPPSEQPPVEEEAPKAKSKPKPKPTPNLPPIEEAI
jgi:hypothetical protein